MTEADLLAIARENNLTVTIGTSVAERLGNISEIGLVLPDGSPEAPAKIKPRDLVEESFEAPGTWVVPVATYSVANSRDIKASIGRKGSQQDKVFGVLGKYHTELARFADYGVHAGKLVRVTITRLAPGTLDEYENLPMATKAVVDACARILGVKDNDQRVKFVAKQEKSATYGVRIRMEFV